MRHIMLIIAITVLALIPASAAQAEGGAGGMVLVDEVFRIAPGSGLRECITVSQMAHLTVLASSPEGRTGETASLNFADDRQTASPTVYLATRVPTEQVISTHLAPAGSYCYAILISHELTSTLPADAPEAPYKQIHLRIISTPYTPS